MRQAILYGVGSTDKAAATTRLECRKSKLLTLDGENGLVLTGPFLCWDGWKVAIFPYLDILCSYIAHHSTSGLT